MHASNLVCEALILELVRLELVARVAWRLRLINQVEIVADSTGAPRALAFEAIDLHVRVVATQRSPLKWRAIQIWVIRMLS